MGRGRRVGDTGSSVVNFLNVYLAGSSMFFLFVACCSPRGCSTTINGTYGLRSYFLRINPGDKVCVNVSAFDFHLIFSDPGPSLIVREYRSFLKTSTLSLYHVYEKTAVPPFLVVKQPFAAFEIETGTSETVALSLGSLAGLCSSGILFTNFVDIDIELSSLNPYPYDLGPNFDKCIVFTSKGLQEYDVKMNCKGKLFVYSSSDLRDYQYYYGDKTMSFATEAKSNPTMLRYLATGKEQNDCVSVSMRSQDEQPSKQWVEIYRPVNGRNRTRPTPKPCVITDFIDFPAVGIYTLFVVCGIVILSCLVYIIARWRCPRIVQYSPKPRSVDPNDSLMESTPSEKRAKPRGYFALDPILRPASDY